MSFHIDLMLEEERRNVSGVSSAFLIRATYIGVPALVIALILSLVMKQIGKVNDLKAKKAELAQLESRIKKRTPAFDAAVQRKQELDNTQLILDEIEWWRDARVSISEHLDGIHPIVPSNVQLQALTFTISPQLIKNKRARVPSCTLRGIVHDPTPVVAEGVADKFTRDLQQSPRLQNKLAKATIAPGSLKLLDDTWTFDVRCEYHPEFAE